jgi:hypothetical protein
MHNLARAVDILSSTGDIGVGRTAPMPSGIAGSALHPVLDGIFFVPLASYTQVQLHVAHAVSFLQVPGSLASVERWPEVAVYLSAAGFSV